LKVSEIYPSNFIAAGDLDGRPVTLTVDRIAEPGAVKREDGQKIDKPILYFVEKPKGPGLVLGKTNARTIRLIHGNDMSRWTGKKVTFYPTTTDMAKRAAEQAGCIILSEHGKMVTVPCIRVSVAAAGISGEPPELS
jgi:hypothetical protein